MSRHTPRKDRWQPQGPARYQSVDGLVVLFEKGAWWAEVRYSLLSPGPTPSREVRLDRSGPFKRPRNAMIDAERHLTLLRNRHGDALGSPGDLG
jgi:hypothetical protein